MSTYSDLASSSEHLTEYNARPLVVLSIAFIPIAIIFTGLRFLARHLSEAPFGLDDILALVSLVLSLGVSIVAICFVHYGGVGYHFAYWEATNPSKIVTYFKYLITVSTFYYLPTVVPKLSILALYSRIFVTRPYRLAIQIVAGVLIANAVVSIIVSFLLCRPLPYYWDRTIPGGKCYDQIAYYTWTGFPNILTDIAMIILPLQAVWRLQSPKSVKMGLTGVIATGGIGLIGSIMRFILFHENAITDGTWHSTSLMIWSSIEIYCYVMAACMVAFRPLVVHITRPPNSKPNITNHAQTAKTSPNHDKIRLLSHASRFSRFSTTFWPVEDGNRRGIGTTKDNASDTVERCIRAQTGHTELSPEKIYVSREWEVTSSGS